MSSTLRSLVPMAHVQSVTRSIEFYRKLGFEVRNTHAPPEVTEPVWAWLQIGDARIMLARADEPVIAAQQAVLFYQYCDDLPSTHVSLQKARLSVGPIERPFYSPGGEFRVEDPDGYVLMITHT